MGSVTPSGAVALARIAEHLDRELRTTDVPDYPGAFNGVQVENVSEVTRCAVAVDASLRTIAGAIETGANLLIVHHGLFWGSSLPLRGRLFERVRRLIASDVAVYASHLPLDLHPTLGNNALLARALGLEGATPFAQFQTIHVGVAGRADVTTESLAAKLDGIAAAANGTVRRVGVTLARRTRHWAVCTGAGASSDTLREAAKAGIDTLIVGEGAHHTAIEADELGIAVLYAGHYATETFGVRALGAEVERLFGIPWSFVDVPSGL